MRFVNYLVVFVALSLAVGCSKKKKEEIDSPTSFAAIESTEGSSDQGTAMGLQTVNFEFDSFALGSTAKAVLVANGEILKANSKLRVQIEGHCDERGGIQYNIALGEKRANSVRQYLMDAGVSGDRLTTVSFGEERPIDPRSSEDAWAKNRRANFAVTAK